MILAVSRAERYSPNSVAKDAAILENVSQKLRRYGYDVDTIGEDELTIDSIADVYVSMSRSERAASILRRLRDKGAIVIAPNIDAELLTCRTSLEAELRRRKMPLLTGKGFNGYWIKKNHGYTEREDDVVYAATERERRAAVKTMAERFGKNGVYVAPHITGDVVKFYGVEGTDFFETYYPGDDGQTKFAHEIHNGKPHHYVFDKERLRDALDDMAYDNGVTFYGGDCIVDQNGVAYVVDFNDWPSYSRCREEAASAITKAVMRIIANARHSIAPRQLVRGFIFDYGGTLDTGGDHWGKVLWHAYGHQGVPISEQLFREAYVHAERALGGNDIIKPWFTFRDTLSTKLDIELRYIAKATANFNCADWHDTLLEELYERTVKHTRRSATVLRDIRESTGNRMVLVSNFYGNVSTVLGEFGLDGVFDDIIESATVGIRKPDPRIFQLGVEALGVKPEETIVVGDSYDKDIIPALRAGCRAVWFMGEGWTDNVPDGGEADEVITSISAMRHIAADEIRTSATADKLQEWSRKVIRKK